MAATLKDISQAAGTSVSTASLILNGRQAHRFSETTKNAVVAAADLMGYRPQRAAQSLVTGKTFNIALIVNSLTNPFFARYASLLHAQLLRHGYTVIPIEIHSEDVDQKGFWMDWIDRRAVDAVIDLQGGIGITQDIAEVYSKFSQHRPIVFRQLVEDAKLTPFAGVVVDYATGCRAMTGHLRDIGCREVGMVTVKGHLPKRCARDGRPLPPDRSLAMIMDALDEAGVRCPDRCVRGAADELAESNDWCEAAYDLLRKEPQVQAIITHNIDTVPAVLHGVRRAGRTVGKDLFLASFDDMPLARWLGPGITVVAEPTREVAAALAGLAVKEIEGGHDDTARKRTLPTGLIVRGSTDANWVPHFS